MGRTLRFAALVSACLMITFVFQSPQVEATPPSDPSYTNYAAAALGGTAAATTWLTGYEPSNAIDQNAAVMWKATSNDALVVDFAGAKDIREIHIHMADYAMPAVDLFYEAGNGAHVLLTSWTGNTAATLVHTVPGGVGAYGIKVSFPSL